MEFIYKKPESFQEAVAIKAAEKDLLYYSGGTEIMTYLRQDKVKTSGLIDLNGIPAYVEIKKEGDKVWIGGGVTMNQIEAFFGENLLVAGVKEIADHTVRNTLTLAGNVCGRLPYREAAIPLYLLNAQLKTVTAEGDQLAPFRERYTTSLKLKGEELFAGVYLELDRLKLPYGTKRFERFSRVDYPIVHVMGIKENGQELFGFSGLCSLVVFPEITDVEKLEEALKFPVVDDDRASKSYRLAVTKSILTNFSWKEGVHHEG